MIARLAALLCLLVLAAPGAALAQGPFDPIPPAPPPAPTTPEQEEQDDDDDQFLSSTQQLLIGISGLVLLGGIAYAILRDARGAAPTEARRGRDEDVHQPKGSRTPARVRHQQSRSKAKAARQARKRARKR